MQDCSPQLSFFLSQLIRKPLVRYPAEPSMAVMVEAAQNFMWNTFNAIIVMAGDRAIALSLNNLHKASLIQEMRQLEICMSCNTRPCAKKMSPFCKKCTEWFQLSSHKNRK